MPRLDCASDCITPFPALTGPAGPLPDCRVSPPPGPTCDETPLTPWSRLLLRFATLLPRPLLMLATLLPRPLLRPLSVSVTLLVAPDTAELRPAAAAAADSVTSDVALLAAPASSAALSVTPAAAVASGWQAGRSAAQPTRAMAIPVTLVDRTSLKAVGLGAHVGMQSSCLYAGTTCAFVQLACSKSHAQAVDRMASWTYASPAAAWLTDALMSCSCSPACCVALDAAVAALVAAGGAASAQQQCTTMNVKFFTCCTPTQTGRVQTSFNWVDNPPVLHMLASHGSRGSHSRQHAGPDTHTYQPRAQPQLRRGLLLGQLTHCLLQQLLAGLSGRRRKHPAPPLPGSQLQRNNKGRR